MVQAAGVGRGGRHTYPIRQYSFFIEFVILPNPHSQTREPQTKENPEPPVFNGSSSISLALRKETD